MIATRHAPLLLAIAALAAQPVAAQVTPAADAVDVAPAQEPVGNAGGSFAEKAALVVGGVAASVIAFKGLSALFKKKAPTPPPPAPAETAPMSVGGE